MTKLSVKYGTADSRKIEIGPKWKKFYSEIEEVDRFWLQNLSSKKLVYILNSARRRVTYALHILGRILNEQGFISSYLLGNVASKLFLIGWFYWLKEWGGVEMQLASAILISGSVLIIPASACIIRSQVLTSLLGSEIICCSRGWAIQVPVRNL